MRSDTAMTGVAEDGCGSIAMAQRAWQQARAALCTLLAAPLLWGMCETRPTLIGTELPPAAVCATETPCNGALAIMTANNAIRRWRSVMQDRQAMEPSLQGCGMNGHENPQVPRRGQDLALRRTENRYGRRGHGSECSGDEASGVRSTLEPIKVIGVPRCPRHHRRSR